MLGVLYKREISHFRVTYTHYTEIYGALYFLVRHRLSCAKIVAVQKRTLESCLSVLDLMELNWGAVHLRIFPNDKHSNRYAGCGTPGMYQTFDEKLRFRTRRLLSAMNLTY